MPLLQHALDLSACIETDGASQSRAKIEPLYDRANPYYTWGNKNDQDIRSGSLLASYIFGLYLDSLHIDRDGFGNVEELWKRRSHPIRVIVKTREDINLFGGRVYG